MTHIFNLLSPFEHFLKHLFYKGLLEFTSFVSFLDRGCKPLFLSVLEVSVDK